MGKLRDSYIININDRTFKAGNDLPHSDYFINSSSVILNDNLYAFGHSKKSIYKYIVKNR